MNRVSSRFEILVLFALAGVLWCPAGLAVETESNPVVQSFDWKPSPGITVNHLEDGSLQIKGRQTGSWNYARATLDLAVLEPGKYVLKGSLCVESIANEDYPPFLKIGMNNQQGEELPKKVTRPYDSSAFNTTQHFVLRFRLDDQVKTAYLAVEKGTKLDNEVALLIKDLVIEQDGNDVELTKENQKALAGLAGIHPRLYLQKQDVPLLKSRLKQAPYSRFWNDIKQRADRYVRQSPPEELPSTENIRPYGKMLPFLAMAYLLSEDDRYLDSAREWMDALCSYPNWAKNKDLGPAHILAGMAVAYDWLYDCLSPAERERYRAKISKHAAIFYDLVVNQSIYWARDYLHNHNHVDAGALGIAGLALYGESPQALEWITAAEKNFQTVLDVLPPDGTWHEGVAYWSYVMEALLRYFDAVAPVFGMDRIKEHPFFQNATRYRLHMSLPGFEKVIPYADSADTDWYGPGYILRKLASLYSDGTAQWLANRIEEARGYKQLFDWQSWLDLIWYDEAIQAVAPDSPPTWAYFSDLGLYVRRSDWTDSASLVFFKAGPPQGIHAQSLDRFVSGHAHPDEGTFLYLLDGDWVIAADGYVYNKMTWNNNVLLFNGVGQLGGGGIWFDGGEIQQFYGDARIEKATSRENFSMVTADLTGIIHPKANVTNWKRSIVIKMDEFILVRDVVDLGSNGDVDSFLHFGNGELFKNGNRFTYEMETIGKVSIQLYSDHDLQTQIVEIEFLRNKGKKDLSKTINAQLRSVQHAVLITVITPAYTRTKPVFISGDEVGGESLNLTVGDQEYFINFVDHVLN